MMAEMCGLPVRLAEMLLEDADQSLSVLECDATATPLSNRCSQMSLLAMSTGMELGLSDAELASLGQAGLLHDLGLFLLPPKFRNPTTAYNASDLGIYQSHPYLTLRLLEGVHSISELVRVLILQVHENADGSGFPRNFKSHRLHPLTRILHVVEVYLSLVNPGPGRPALVPHDALTFLLFQCQKGNFSPQVLRAFINQITLFPIGSRVLLNDGQQATVVRRNADQYDQPFVIFNNDARGQPQALAGTELRIVSPLVRDQHSQMRLEKEILASLTLDSLI